MDTDFDTNRFYKYHRCEKKRIVGNINFAMLNCFAECTKIKIKLTIEVNTTNKTPALGIRRKKDNQRTFRPESFRRQISLAGSSILKMEFLHF